MDFRHFLILLVLTLLGCKTGNQELIEHYPNQMGEISFNAETDDPAFQLCNEQDLVHSRVSLSYDGGRARILKIGQNMIKNTGLSFDYTGYIMVHFLVNCQGQPGRFRFEAMDMGFMEQDAPAALLDSVDKVVRSLDEWIITRATNAGKDHSKYLNFKFVNGQLDAITH